jgi:hypothetical protein
MNAKVTNLAEIFESREQAHWDRQARAAGFANFAALEAAHNAAFDAACDWLEANCTHADKHPDLGMCEDCAEQLP